MARNDQPLEYRAAAIGEIYELRFEILRPKQVPMKLHFPGDDGVPPATWHFGAFAGKRNVACLTFFASTWEEKPALQLRGMAVAADHQSQGIGTRLLAAASAGLAQVPGIPPLWWCNARVEAIRFYERNGWRVVSDAFMIAPVGLHKKMVRTP